MFVPSLALALGLAGAVSAATVKVVTFTDTYDNYTTVGGSTVSGITVALSHGGYQNDLNYNQFAIGAPSALDGIVPKSKPNTIFVALPTSAQSGSVSLSPSSTILKSGSIKSFTALSFYFGCLVDAGNGEVAAAEGCDIAVTGVDTNGKTVASQSFSFAPASTTGQQLSLADLTKLWPGTKLVSLTFGISDAVLTPAASVLVIDNLKHTNYY